jgi:hypothetical protein
MGLLPAQFVLRTWQSSEDLISALLSAKSHEPISRNLIWFGPRWVRHKDKHKSAEKATGHATSKLLGRICMWLADHIERSDCVISK